MKDTTKHILLLILFGLFGSSYLPAQISRFDIEFPSHSDFDELNIDANGNIWIAGYFDFFKYNGHQLNSCRIKMPVEGNFFGEIIFIENKILVGYQNQIFLFHPDTETHELIWELPSGHSFIHSHQDDLGHIWIFSTNPKDETYSIFRITDGKDFKYMFNLSLDFTIDLDLGVDDINGQLYLTGRWDGLKIIDNNGKELELQFENRSDFLEKYPCSVFRVDNQNNLWRIYQNDFEIYNQKTKRFESHPISGQINIKSRCNEYDKGFSPHFIFRDSKNRIWVGGEDSHLYFYEPTTNQLTFFGKKLVDHLGGGGGEVGQLLEDKNGNIWGKKRGGIFKIHEKATYFQSYAVDTHLEDHPIYEDQNHINQTIDHFGEFGKIASAINSISEDESGNIFFVDKRFIFKIDAATNQLQTLPIFTQKSKLRFWIFDDKRYLATWDGFYNIDENNHLVKHTYPYKQLGGILQQKNGDFWLRGDASENLYLLSKKKNISDTKYEGNYKSIENNSLFDRLFVKSMTEYEDGIILLGTYSWLYKIDTKSERVEKMKNKFTFQGKEISFDNTYNLNIQYLGNNLLGFVFNQAFGILDLSKMELTHYNTIDKLGIDHIKGNPYFHKNSLWFGQNKKLSTYNFDTKELIHFSEKEGISVGDFVEIIQSLSNERLGAGTYNGLYIFNPDTLIHNYKNNIKNNENLKLKLEGYSVLDGQRDSLYQSIYFLDAPETHIELGHNDKLLQLDFSLQHFATPKAHLFSYWLEGYENDWSPPNNSNTVKYTSLPSGEYNLKVRANLGNGIWSAQTLEIPITVHPAWYRSWWFYGLCLLALAGIAFLISRYYYHLEKTKLLQKQEQEEAQRLKEVDQLKSRFYTNITHEFRTPLTVIMGMTENIEGHSNERNLIKRNSNNLLRLINQLLDLSKAEAGNLKLNNTQGDIISYLRYLTESFYSMATDKGIRLTFYSEVDKMVMDYDELKIQQIIYNLLSNAIKFTKEDGKIVLHTNQIDKDGMPFLKIKVQDTGIGIPQEVIPHLFDRFYQADNSSTRKGEGTGIGLTLTHELIHLMNGTIEVNSKVHNPQKPLDGGGTEFIVWLPITKHLQIKSKTQNEIDSFSKKENLSVAPVITPNGSVHQQIDSDAPILLIVEDNPDVVFYIRSLLEKDYQIQTAKNGALGIEKAIEIIPDIIISDVMMPVKDGYEVCEALKQDERTSHIPIVLLTAKATHDDKIEGLKYGADAYLTKPFRKDELMIRLEKLVAMRQQLQLRYSPITTTTVPTLPTEGLPLEDSFLEKLKTIVEQNLDNNQFGVPELGDAISMSKMQVYRKLKALTNQTPSVFIRTIRLQKGKELLETSEMTISEIAYDVGFSDPNYFSKTFQKEFGKSPRDFRS